MSSAERIKKELAEAAKIREPAERSVKIASIVAEALRAIGQDPILVGGAAVEFYTQGGYTTADIDMIAPGGPALFEKMAEMGFERMGKDFVDEKNKIYIEFPGRVLGPTERDRRILIGERYLRIISIEDLIVDRLCSFKYWKSAIDGLNGLKLLEVGPEDEDLLLSRAKEEGVLDALELVKKVQEEIIRKRVSPREANRLLETGMIRLKK